MPRTETAPRRTAPQRGRPLRSAPAAWIAAARIALLALITALAVRTLLAEPFSIPSPSMMPALMPGDYVLVMKYPYGYSAASLPWGAGRPGRRVGAELPLRGDVVVFTDPRGSGEHFIKRIIGLPGETVAVSGGTVYVDGVPLNRHRVENFRFAVRPATPCIAGRLFAGAAPTCDYAQYEEELPSGAGTIRVTDMQGDGALSNMPPRTVPSGHLFVLGDNRENSGDSRLPVAEGGFGMVPLGALVGRADFIFFSTDGTAEWGQPLSLLHSIRPARLGAVS